MTLGDSVLTDYTIGVLEDSILILQLLSDNPDGMSLADVTTSSGFVTNKVFRILYTLQKHQIVERSENGNFHLGHGLMALSQGILYQSILIDASSSVMDRLVAETSESIFLGVVNGSDALCIAVRQSPRSVRLFAEVGRRAPLHSGGVPKVLFAYLPETERARLLDKVFANTPISPSADRPAFEQLLMQIRAQGYAIVRDELDIGAHSVAAPIYNHQGHVIAAISIAGPSNRFDDARIDRYVGLVTEAAGQISRALGYEGEPAFSDELLLPR
jgi:IclR family transcriptional regulator, KDG regulon repressor